MCNKKIQIPNALLGLILLLGSCLAFGPQSTLADQIQLKIEKKSTHGPWLNCPGQSDHYCRTHWTGEWYMTPTASKRNLRAGQLVKISNITGSVYYGNVGGFLAPASCREGLRRTNGSYGNYNLQHPYLVLVAQFVELDTAGRFLRVVAPGITDAAGNAKYPKSAIPAQDFETSNIYVPAGANAIYFSFPDSRYVDNHGVCSFQCDVSDPRVCETGQKRAHPEGRACSTNYPGVCEAGTIFQTCDANGQWPSNNAGTENSLVSCEPNIKPATVQGSERLVNDNCDNGIDDDCDGLTDTHSANPDPDCSVPNDCDQHPGKCQSDCVPMVDPDGNVEMTSEYWIYCSDGIDNDCDGVADECDSDCPGSCNNGPKTCPDGKPAGHRKGETCNTGISTPGCTWGTQWLLCQREQDGSYDYVADSDCDPDPDTCTLNPPIDPECRMDLITAKTDITQALEEIKSISLDALQHALQPVNQVLKGNTNGYRRKSLVRAVKNINRAIRKTDGNIGSAVTIAESIPDVVDMCTDNCSPVRDLLEDSERIDLKAFLQARRTRAGIRKSARALTKIGAKRYTIPSALRKKLADVRSSLDLLGDLLDEELPDEICG